MARILSTRLVHGISASALGPVATTLIQVVSVPLLLKGWGVQRYGEWLLLSALPSYLAISDMGFASAAANQMSMQVAAGNRRKALQVFQSITALLSVLSLFALACAAIAAKALPIREMLHIQTLTKPQITNILVILSSYSLVTLFGGVANAGLRCAGSFARGVTIQNLTRLVESCVMVCSVLLGADMTKAALSLLLVRTIGVMFMAGDLKYRSPWLRIGIRDAEFATIRELFVPAVSFMAIPLGSAASLQGTVLAVGHVLGPVAATTFSTLRTLTRFVPISTDILRNAVWPEISFAIGKPDLPLARRLYQTTSQVLFWLTLFAALFLAFTGNFLFSSWTHNRLPFDQITFLLLLVAAIATSLWFTAAVPLLASNSHSRLATQYVLLTWGSILLTLGLTSSFRLRGTSASIVATDTAMWICALTGSSKALGEPVIRTLRSLFDAAAVGNIRSKLDRRAAMRQSEAMIKDAAP